MATPNARRRVALTMVEHLSRPKYVFTIEESKSHNAQHYMTLSIPLSHTPRLMGGRLQFWSQQHMPLLIDLQQHLDLDDLLGDSSFCGFLHVEWQRRGPCYLAIAGTSQRFGLLPSVSLM